MKHLILCHFDERMGPQIILKAPRNIDDEDFEQVPLLMDLYDRGFFVHIFGGFKSANLIFEIPSPVARGKVEMLLISIMIPDGEFDADLYEALLENFYAQMMDISKVYVGLHDKRSQQNKEIRNLFFSFYDSIPEETKIYERQKSKILVFGLSGAGKRTLISDFQSYLTESGSEGTPIDLSNFLIDDLSIVKYDISRSTDMKEFMPARVQDQDAIVFIVDSTDRAKYEDAKEALHKLANVPELKDIPLLILFNKTDLNDAEVVEISRAIAVSDLPQRDIKYLVTASLSNDEIRRAFEWLITKIGKKKRVTKPFKIGFLLSLWNQDVGLEMLAIYPDSIVNNLQEIAIRCVNVSRGLFGERNPKRSFFVLPFSRLSLNAAIFSDLIPEDDELRPSTPIFLTVLYEDTIPSEILSKFNERINQAFGEILDNYSEPGIVESTLKRLHSEISKNLQKDRSTLRALIKAKHRYQTLFEASRDAIVVFDYKTGLIVDANRAVEDILGKPLEDIIGLHPTELQSEVEYTKMRSIIVKQSNNKITQPVEFLLKFLDGTDIPVEIYANKVNVGGKNLIQCNFRDISERINNEKALRRNQERVRNLLDAIPDMIFRVSKDGKIIDFKLPTELAKFVSKPVYENKKIDDIVPSDVSKEIYHYIDLTLETGKMQQFRYILPAQNTDNEFEARMVPIKDDEIVSIVRHIGSIKKKT